LDVYPWQNVRQILADLDELPRQLASRHPEVAREAAEAIAGLLRDVDLDSLREQIRPTTTT
jgi:hypothetical protein